MREEGQAKLHLDVQKIVKKFGDSPKLHREMMVTQDGLKGILREIGAFNA